MGCLGGDDPTERAVAHLDTDNDFIPDQRDNCPNVRNTSQKNSNVDSELNQETSTGGDACDAHPVGETQVFGWQSNGGGVRSVTTDQIIVDTHRNQAAADLETGLRFCRCFVGDEDTVQDRLDCEFEVGDGTGESLLDDVENYYGIASPWNHLSASSWLVEDTNEECNGPCDPEAPVSYSRPDRFFDEEVTFEWNLASDADAWNVDVSTGQFEMPGVLWTHTPGPWEQADDPLADRKLQNHYLTMVLTSDQSGYSADPDDVGIGPFLARSPLCPHCDAAFPVPYLAWSPCLGQGGCSDIPEVRFADGAWNATGLFTSGSTTGLGQVPGTWFTASEPDDLLHGNGVRYAAIKSDGTQVNAVLNLTSGGWQKVVPPAPGTKPAARSEFGTVVSAAQNRIYVMGGVNGSGALLQDLWAYNLSTLTWSQISLSGTNKPNRVLAAAYAPYEAKLIVLDKVISGPTTTYRILRVPVAGGAPTVAGSWTRTTTAPTIFSRAVEPWGMGYVGARGTSSRHRLLVFAHPGGSSLALAQTKQASGTMTNRNIRVDDIVVTLLVPNAGGVPHPVGYVMEDLPTTGGSTGLCF